MAPDAHGELLYSEAVALGLYPTYGPESGSADAGLVTYGVEGPSTPPHFGEERGPDVIIVPPQRP